MEAGECQKMQGLRLRRSNQSNGIQAVMRLVARRFVDSCDAAWCIKNDFAGFGGSFVCRQSSHRKQSVPPIHCRCRLAVFFVPLLRSQSAREFCVAVLPSSCQNLCQIFNSDCPPPSINLTPGKVLSVFHTPSRGLVASRPILLSPIHVFPPSISHCYWQEWERLAVVHRSSGASYPRMRTDEGHENR